ncbi:Glucosyltransferase GtrII-like protein [Bordetella sputigena]|uniref:glucosyltransferase domain-containing protein n=1 Tax=Bordetella sputigena TaxID=1416810 RepID=UPI0039EFB6F4
MHPDATPTSRQKVFIAALLLYGLAIFYPILHADRFYIDDLGRARTGYLGWTTDGRPLANVLVETLNLGTPISDLTPLPQLLAALLLAYLAVTVAKRFDIPGTWRAPLILAPLVANPFFLENLSYKFDVLPMTLATALSCMAVTTIPMTRWGRVLGSVALLAALCLYQPTLNVFLVFVFAEFALAHRDLPSPRALFGTLAIRGAQLAAALLAYTIVIAGTVRGHYATAHGAIATMGALPGTVQSNLVAFWRYALNLLPGLWTKPLWWSAGAGMLAAIGWSVRYLVVGWSRASIPARIAMSASVILLPLAFVLAPWGPMLALEAPVFAPRVAVGLGALGAAGLLLLWTVLQRVRLAAAWQVAALAVSVYGLFLFCFVYGQSLKQQKDFENRIAAQISDDLYRIAGQHALTGYMLKGRLGHAVLLQRTIGKYPLIGALVPVYLTQGWGWADDELRNFGVELKHEMATPPDIPRDPPVAVSRNYRIYLDHDIAIIAFTPVP